MATCYSKEYFDTHDFIHKQFFTGGDIDAKKERDILAKHLRKEGWIVKTKKWSMPDISNKDCYTLDAERLKKVI